MSQLHHSSHIMVIDQNRLFRERIAYLLSQDSNHYYHVITNFENIEEGLSYLKESTMDLLLIEAALIKNDFQFNLLKSIIQHHPQLRIILLTSQQQSCLHAPLQRLEQAHLHTKSIDSHEFLIFIAKVLQHHDEEAANYLEDLTPRELEILEWLVKGDSNKEIARELSISESTVKVHVQNILKKFKVSSRVEAAVYAVRNDLSA